MNELCVFLDRDGVINEDSTGYIKSVDEWLPIAGSLAAIAKLNTAGYRVFVMTNQSGIGRGYYSLEDLQAIHEILKQRINEYAEVVVFGILVSCNVWILLYPVFYW